MRRKKHLEDKLSLCTNLISVPPVIRDYRLEIKEKAYIDFTGIFHNNNPLQMEIGCGKGKFICELAKRNPDINYIAIEVNPNVLCGACMLALEKNISNYAISHTTFATNFGISITIINIFIFQLQKLTFN